MQKKNQIELSLGIIVALIAITALVLSTLALVKESNLTKNNNNNTDYFLPQQVDLLKSWTTKMSFNAQNYLTAKGFTDTLTTQSSSTPFLATGGAVTSNTETTNEFKAVSATTGNFLSIAGDTLTCSTANKNTVTTISPTTITTPTLVCSNTLTCTTLNCSSIDTGTWNATTIGVVHGGTGLTTTTPYAIFCGGTTATGNFQQVAVGTAGQFLASQGASAVPTFIDGPTLQSGTYIPIVTDLTTTWDVTGTQTAAFYTVLGNNYTVYGKIVATNSSNSPALEPFSITFQVPGSSTFSDTVSLRGNANALNLDAGTSFPTNITSFSDVTTRLVHVYMVPATISGVSATDSWEFNFTCSYRI